jgi:hypothetical protein
MKTKVPSAIVYGTGRQGLAQVQNTIYGNLRDKIEVNFMSDVTNVESDLTNWPADIVIVTGDQVKKVPSDLSADISHRLRILDVLNMSDLGNFILKESTNMACTIHNEVYFSKDRPFFSVFTPAYKTGNRINRLYNSLAKQTWKD